MCKENLKDYRRELLYENYFYEKTTLKPVSIPEGVYVPGITYFHAILFPITLKNKICFMTLWVLDLCQALAFHLFSVSLGWLR